MTITKADLELLFGYAWHPKQDEILTLLANAINAAAAGDATITKAQLDLLFGFAWHPKSHEILTLIADAINAAAVGDITITREDLNRLFGFAWHVKSNEILQLLLDAIAEAAAAQAGGLPAWDATKAAHFDGSQSLVSVAPISDSDVSVLSFSMRLKLYSGNGTSLLTLGGGSVYCNPAVGALPENNNVDIAVASSDAFTEYMEILGPSPTYPTATWFNLRGKFNSTAGTYELYIDNTQIVSFAFSDVDGTPFTIPFSSNLVRIVDSGNLVFDVTDWWVGAGVDAAFSATGDDFITADGASKDPAGFPAGGILFSGDAAGWAAYAAANGFTITGTLTDAVGPG